MERLSPSCAILLTLLLPALGQEAPGGGERATIDACLREPSNAPESCIGLFYKACIDSREGGTTAGMGDCAGRETAIWQSKIDATMKQLLDGSLGQTVAKPWNRPEGNKRDREVPGTDIINDMEKTWAAWRVKKCDAMAMQAEDGSLSRVIYGSCIYDETARHALWLKELLDDSTPK